jgi:hypothetical protein
LSKPQRILGARIIEYNDVIFPCPIFPSANFVSESWKNLAAGLRIWNKSEKYDAGNF